jgi:hypothetical protein
MTYLPFLGAPLRLCGSLMAIIPTNLFRYRRGDITKKKIKIKSFNVSRYTCNACLAAYQGAVSWNCRDCDFDLCTTCYAKRNNGTFIVFVGAILFTNKYSLFNVALDPTKNIDILGIYTAGSEFTLTNITFGGKFNCATASLVKNA